MNNIVITSFLLTTLVCFYSCRSGLKTAVKNDSVTTQNKEDSLLASPGTLSSSKNHENQDTIAGHYTSAALEEGGSAPGCQITVDIVKRQAQYFYTLTSDTTYKGKVSLSKSKDSKETYITFEGIEWAEYEGDISNDTEEEKEQKPEIKLPVGIDGQFTGKEITIQNYGNSMNYYVKLAGCGDKYIRLVKK
jgi:hypothetical protein